MDGKEIFFNLNPVNFFIVSGLVQNFIMAGILFFRKGENALANKLLSATIFIVNMHLTYLMVLDTNLDNFFPFLLWAPYSYLTAVGPLIFFYTKALTDSGFRISDVSTRHFIPVVVEVGLQAIMIAQAILDEKLLYNTPLYFYVTPLVYVWTIGSIFYYLNLSVGVINDHETWTLRRFSNTKDITLTWLKKLINYYRLLWVVWIPFVTAFLLFFRFQLMYLVIVLVLYLLMLILTYLTFWIGVEGLGRGTLVIVKSNDGQGENKNFNKLTNKEIQEFMDRITQAMTREKKYLNESLNLRELALHLKADPNLISFILNNHLDSNFYDFVNRYRVEEVKNRLNDPSNKYLTLLGVALESGFNSKTTFNRVFKQVTGLTPTEFQKDREKHP